MEASELIALAEVEDRYWWYKERRSILAKELRRLPKPGTALDIGAAGGGNTRVLRAHGWKSMALEYTSTAAEIARDRAYNNIQRLINEAAKGELTVVIDRTFPLSEAAAAHEYIESRQAVGRVLLIP